MTQKQDVIEQDVQSCLQKNDINAACQILDYHIRESHKGKKYRTRLNLESSPKMNEPNDLFHKYMKLLADGRIYECELQNDVPYVNITQNTESGNKSKPQTSVQAVLGSKVAGGEPLPSSNANLELAQAGKDTDLQTPGLNSTSKDQSKEEGDDSKAMYYQMNSEDEEE